MEVLVIGSETAQFHFAPIVSVGKYIVVQFLQSCMSFTTAITERASILNISSSEHKSKTLQMPTIKAGCAVRTYVAKHMPPRN